jgi:hypothetical protein
MLSLLKLLDESSMLWRCQALTEYFHNVQTIKPEESRGVQPEPWKHR